MFQQMNTYKNYQLFPFKTFLCDPLWHDLAHNEEITIYPLNYLNLSYFSVVDTII